MIYFRSDGVEEEFVPAFLIWKLVLNFYIPS